MKRSYMEKQHVVFKEGEKKPVSVIGRPVARERQ
jgi:hypothetical protein